MQETVNCAGALLFPVYPVKFSNLPVQYEEGLFDPVRAVAVFAEQEKDGRIEAYGHGFGVRLVKSSRFYHFCEKVTEIFNTPVKK